MKKVRAQPTMSTGSNSRSAIQKSWGDASTFEQGADRREIIGVGDPIVMRSSEFMVCVVDHQLVPAIAFGGDMADLFDQVEQVRPFQRWLAVLKDLMQRLLVDC
jgi:hypothetical protein